MNEIPDGLPTLTRGPHVNPAAGACVMEFVSVLAGERWSDKPQCVNHRLAYLAQHINDNTDDVGRRKLAVMAPMFIGTRAATQDADTLLSGQVSARWFKFRDSLVDRTMYVDDYGVTRAREGAFEEIMRTEGVALLRDLISMCDEFNGYDRSETQVLVEVPA